MNTDIHIALSEDNRKIKLPPILPTLFLAGPIRNAPKWHYDAIRYLLNKDTKTFIAVPIRTVPDDIKPHILLDEDLFFHTFERQRAWELYYLFHAKRKGCIMFWLPKEAEVKEFQDKIYAHITMMELGTAMGSYTHKPFNLVVGTDGEFPEWNTIKLDLEENKIPICYTLEDTIETALKLIHG